MPRTPLTYMLEVMRDPEADPKRRDATAMAAAPYPHARLSTIDAKLSPAAPDLPTRKTSVEVRFVVPGAAHARDDQE
jgi:hypothetical protein